MLPGSFSFDPLLCNIILILKNSLTRHIIMDLFTASANGILIVNISLLLLVLLRVVVVVVAMHLIYIAFIH